VSDKGSLLIKTPKMKMIHHHGMEITIRDMKVDEIDDVLALWKRAGLPFKPEGRDSPEKILEQVSEDTCKFIVAVEDDTKVIGTVLVTHDGRKGWINRLAVAPEHRRRGIAGILVERAERELEIKGIGIIACLVEGWNGISREVFESLGFEEFHGVKYMTKRKDPDI
jgi:ribosomal protein S18 acetylase RimI-like enzyme